MSLSKQNICRIPASRGNGSTKYPSAIGRFCGRIPTNHRLDMHAAVLREDFHIVGCLRGCLPRFPQQNNHLGLPLQLSPEEVTLLLEKDAIKLVKTDNPLPLPSLQEVEEHKNFRKRNYEEQIQLFKEERKKEIARNIPRIIEGKKQKLRKELDAKKQKGEHVEDSEYDADITVNVEDVEIPDIAEKHSLIQLHTRDPSRYHSHFIAICLPHNKEMSMLDVISMGRLGSNVRKTVLLCSVDDDGKLCYTSLQWTGIT
ncbi:hypothetical protein FSP39_023355 [Pinctada imbricata]|uniref:tRNA-intron lyase n=1 Tax=Pinctada imbricata TaxID=66713 RepID=A0AA89BZT7_PINIB|nr:hypothetical protein FSP39_023355 [Pinctada imbricata]